MLKVYLAARYSRKEEMSERAKELENLGISVTSRWLHEPASANGLGSEEAAQQDIEDIDTSDLVVLFTESPEEAYVRGGRHFESGYAFGKGKPLITCGPIENTFHHIRKVVNIPIWEDLKSNLVFLGKVKEI